MKYRNRWVIVSPVGFSQRVYSIGASSIVIASELFGANGVYVVDVINEYGDIREAFLSSRQVISDFVEACAYLGFGSSAILEFMGSYALDFAEMNVFELLVVRNFAQVMNRNKIEIADLDLYFSSKKGVWGAPLTSVAKGLMAESIADEVIMLHSGIESIGRIESTEFVYSDCPKCHHRVSTGRKATKKFIKTLMGSEGDSGESHFAKFDKLRNKVGHGEHFQSVEEFEGARSLVASVKGGIVHLLDERIKFARKSNAQLFVSYPMLIFEATKKSENDFDIRMKKSSQKIQLTVVRGKKGVSPKNFEARLGFLGSEKEILPTDFLRLLFLAPQDGDC